MESLNLVAAKIKVGLIMLCLTPATAVKVNRSMHYIEISHAWYSHKQKEIDYYQFNRLGEQFYYLSMFCHKS